MGETGPLAIHPAQAKAPCGVEIGDLQAPVIECEAFRGAGFQEQLAVIRPNQMLRQNTPGVFGVKLESGGSMVMGAPKMAVSRAVSR